MITCKKCKERLDTRTLDGTYKGVCGGRIPTSKYPVPAEGPAPYWCPRRKKEVSKLLSGILHIWQDHANKWACSVCGKDISTAPDGQKYCPDCEKEYMFKTKGN